MGAAVIDSAAPRHDSDVVAISVPQSQTMENASVEAGQVASMRLRAMLEEHFRFIFRSLRRLGVQSADLDDAAQQVFIVASNNLVRIESGKERAFLFGTAIRVAANARRAQSNRASLQKDSKTGATRQSPPAPDELLERKERRELLDRVLQELAPELRTIFVLYELEGMSSPEIAAMLEVPLGTVASRLRRAREGFQAEVQSMHEKLISGGRA